MSLYKDNIIIKKIIFVVLAVIGSLFLSYFLSIWRFKIFILAFPICLLLLFLSIKRLSNISWYKNFSKLEIFVFASFTVVLSLSLFFGFYIDKSAHVDGDSLYIIDYQLREILLLPFLLVSVFIPVSAIYSYIKDIPRNKTIKSKKNNIKSKIINIFFNNPKVSFDFSLYKVNWKHFLIGGLVALCCFVPYLMTYFPGLIAGDTISYFNSNWPFPNHHPIMHIIMFKACLVAALFIGKGFTEGIFIYTIIQMILFGAGLSYIFLWFFQRLNIKKVWFYVLLALLCISPYIGTYSIIAWKDPLFSVVVCLFTLKCFDFVVAIKKNYKFSISWWLLFWFYSFCIVFLRNNGLFILILVLLTQIIFTIINFKKSNNGKSIQLTFNISLACIILLSAIILGPVYNKLGIEKSETSESYGLLLSQIAYTYVNDGNLDEQDLQFINRIIPLEEIPRSYDPFLIDGLKWNPTFDDNALNSGFFQGYFRILFKNPILFFKSWQCMTFGYWSINSPHSYDYKYNILRCWVQNLDVAPYAESAVYGNNIRFQNLLNNDIFYKIFPIESYCIPLSWINWMVLFLLICCFFRYKKRFLLTLIPTLTIVFTLLIASPICYWPRYEFAAQLLILFYIALFVIIKKYTKFKL